MPFLKPLVGLFYNKTDKRLERNVFGILFKNPVGLAAGVDTDGKYCKQLSDLGFGFIELGSVSPLPQKGEPKPAFVKLPKDKAVIARSGYENNGVRNLINNIKKSRPDTVIAANITKNNLSEGDQIIKDYSHCFTMLYDFVDMFVVNINYSSADGPSDISYLSEIVDELLETRMTLDMYKPVLLKLTPDIGHSQVDEILNYAQLSGIDGIVAGGSTKSRENLVTSPKKLENTGNGGLSGAPIFNKNLELVKYIVEKTKGRLPVIGCGGIMKPEDAATMLDAGASLVEIGTGYIYKGPKLLKKINKHLLQKNA